jgi:hypothetical protein
VPDFATDGRKHRKETKLIFQAGGELRNCDFEQDLCGWGIDSELNRCDAAMNPSLSCSTEAFVFGRTTGDMQDGTSGPALNHDGKTNSASPGQTQSLPASFPAYFIWASAMMGTPDSLTSLSSPSVTLEMNVCFKFWFDMSVL